MAQLPDVVHDTHMRMVHARDRDKRIIELRRNVTSSKEILKDAMPR
jgi:hypothetical protein